MLILAGVSLNATIGENGIITQAQNASVMQGIVALEEYLQTEYVKYYGEESEYTNKIELLSDKIGNLCLKDGTKNYITYNGKMYYLINKQALPNDVKMQLKNGDTTEYAKYIRLIDVYGVTEDLRVFYCEDGTDNVLGTISDLEIDPNTVLPKLNSNPEMKEAITDILKDMGIEVDESLGITAGNVSGIKEIILDGSKNNITSLSGISELTKLKKVTLKNLNLNNLDGIQSCTLLNYIYLQNTEIQDYAYLKDALKLEELYINLESASFDCNNQIEKLGNGLKDSQLTELKKFGIFGYDVLEKTWDSSKGIREDTYVDTDSLRDFGVDKTSGLTDISGLENISDITKGAIKYMYLNNNNLTDNGGLSALSKFTGLQYLTVANNSNLTNLNGLENLNLINFYAQNCNLLSIEGLKGNNSLKILSIKNNPNLTSLAGIEYNDNCTNLTEIRASYCKISDISALEGSNVQYLSLSSQRENALKNVNTLQTCMQIRYLYLAGNTAIYESDIVLIKNIILACETNYSLDKKYSLVFLEQAKCDLSNYNLTSEQFSLLTNNESILELNLKGNNSLTNEDIEKVLSTCTKVQKLIIDNINLTTINFVKNMPNLWYLDIRGCSNLNDLNILEELAKEEKLAMAELYIDNNNIQLKSIQAAMNDIYSRYEYGKKNGIKLGTVSLVKQLEECTKLTSIATYGEGNATNVDLNLTKLTKLTQVNICAVKWNMKFPVSLEIYKSDGRNRCA